MIASPAAQMPTLAAAIEALAFRNPDCTQRPDLHFGATFLCT
jgi:hypothetical protein